MENSFSGLLTSMLPSTIRLCTLLTSLAAKLFAELLVEWRSRLTETKPHHTLLCWLLRMWLRRWLYHKVMNYRRLFVFTGEDSRHHRPSHQAQGYWWQQNQDPRTWSSVCLESSGSCWYEDWTYRGLHPYPKWQHQKEGRSPWSQALNAEQIFVSPFIYIEGEINIWITNLQMVWDGMSFLISVDVSECPYQGIHYHCPGLKSVTSSESSWLGRRLFLTIQVTSLII